ncbi:hypothetical protein EYB53_009685 [Candidatus Chloroploca sp. M-50]|uniref:DUF4199 domain-containing protein n=1 Tax=Candidatus Chloroploca mongolica TaxID=2528176 RepID=A0ABS4D950_9CHLR|nr:hypothetical protein [Candidatus Chloroploca mongolica]MBP1465973.1 hypothetical protein [Candidatus Chloroploca mongolica]
MSHQQERGLFLQGEDLGRALVFSSFWGSIFYLLAFVSQLLAFRRPPAEVQSKPTLTGAGIFVGGFVGLGTLGIAIVSLLKGKSPAEQAREQLGTAGEGGSNSVFGTALGAGLGSVVPFSVAVGSMRLAERITGVPAVGPQEHVDLPRAAAVNALLTALIAAAVTRITGWVARDARAAERTRM